MVSVAGGQCECCSLTASIGGTHLMLFAVADVLYGILSCFQSSL